MCSKIHVKPQQNLSKSALLSRKNKAGDLLTSIVKTVHKAIVTKVHKSIKTHTWTSEAEMSLCICHQLTSAQSIKNIHLESFWSVEESLICLGRQNNQTDFCIQPHREINSKCIKNTKLKNYQENIRKKSQNKYVYEIRPPNATSIGKNRKMVLYQLRSFFTAMKIIIYVKRQFKKKWRGGISEKI